LHAVGFDHMHCASDRDNYVRINLDNVEPAAQHNFDKVSITDYSQFGVPYDFTSVMHYEDDAFAMNPNVPTMVSLTGDKIRPDDTMWSWMDVERINRAFCGKPS
jgi:Astacin (Peptidase family M12A)